MEQVKEVVERGWGLVNWPYTKMFFSLKGELDESG